LIVEGDYSQKSGYEGMQQVLEREPRPTAVFCTADAMAAGALLALHQAGLRVPHDVAVVGYDNLPLSRFTIPPLTTVDQPIYRMGERAADIIIDLIEGKESKVAHIQLQADLVVRETCGAQRDAEPAEGEA
jgi:LacI family transcriptional regulator